MELKKVVLITTGQPSTNPRIVKEADALHAAGFNVVMLYCHFIDWASKTDVTLLKKKLWDYRMVGGDNVQNRFTYFYTRARFKISHLLHRYLGSRLLLAERSQARAYDELLRAAKKIKADWYIGHNLGALSVAVKAANFNGGKAGFDFEDYHRGENDDSPWYEKRRIILLEEKYVPQLDYISAASPLIAKRIAANFPEHPAKVISILNCFPLEQQPVFREKKASDKSLQLFWFSQTIGTNRGIEDLIDVLLSLKDPDIHLTLAGRCDADFKKYLDSHAQGLKDQVHFAGIISAEYLPAFASGFDVGLALEPTVPENRNICLTNKVFTYILAGNAVILSETNMQKDFNDQYNIGSSFKNGDTAMLGEIIINFKNHAILEKQRRHNYKLALNKLNWDIESDEVLKHIR